MGLESLEAMAPRHQRIASRIRLGVSILVHCLSALYYSACGSTGLWFCSHRCIHCEECVTECICSGYGSEHSCSRQSHTRRVGRSDSTCSCASCLSSSMAFRCCWPTRVLLASCINRCDSVGCCTNLSKPISNLCDRHSGGHGHMAPTSIVEGDLPESLPVYMCNDV